jgi:hypothetical protein
MISFLVVITSMQTSVSAATPTNNQMKGIISLEANRTYSYDLNGDNKEDKVYYESTFIDDSYSAVLKLYVNDKLCFTKEDDGSIGYAIQICDLDTSDNYLDLYIYALMDSVGIKYSSFARYTKESTIENTTFEPDEPTSYLSFFRYSLNKVKGDGTFIIEADTPIYTEAIGCYLCYLTYKIDESEIARVSAKTYSFNQYSKSYKYKAQKSFSAYKKVGSKSILFKVKKGNTVTFDKLYISKSGKAYVRVINSNGKKAWISANQSNLFYELPVWG